MLPLFCAFLAAMHTPMTSPLQKLAALTPAQRAAVLDSFSDEALRTLNGESLLEFIPRMSKGYEAPRHLLPLVRELERARDEEVRLVVHAPPRHTKTETILHAIAWMLEDEPARTHAFATYSSDLSSSKSRKARILAEAAGVRLASDGNRLGEWRTTAGGGLLATGVGGPLTGHGVSGLLVVDDPVKNRVEAESATMRERVWEWFNDVAYTRLERGGSVIVVMTRWHPDDLAGKLVRESGWRYLRLPALDGNGGALWPSRFPAEKLAEIREQVGEYTWASLYQGEPRSRGGALFTDARTYDALPTEGCRVAIGIDCAYTAKKSSDYSVAVVMAEAKGVFYLLDVLRVQSALPVFRARLDGARAAHPRARTRWYTSSIESEIAHMIGVEPQLAREDKFVRAQPVAAAWNAGKILVPKHAPWLDAFLAEVMSFTGVNDDHDDQVDALAAAYDVLAPSSDAARLAHRLALFTGRAVG